jgi:glycosyltransferase involved in cell wall biosynthesis
MEIRISAVAPTYRRRHGLPRFVEALLSPPELHELVVASDGSDDGSVEWLERRRLSDERLVVLDLPNRGVGPTRQAGIEAATGDVVLLMDDDVIASPGLVAGHARHHTELEPKLVLGYMPNEWDHLPPGRRGLGYIYRRWYELFAARFASEPQLVLYGLWGGNFSMPRAEFLKVRMDRLAVRRGQDDREFGIRCQKAGIRGVYDRSLRAEHLYDRNMDQYRNDCRFQGISRTLVQGAHVDVLPGDRPDDHPYPMVWEGVGTGLPSQLRRVWPTLARDPFFGLMTATLTLLWKTGVRTEHLGLEVQAARAIGSLETMRGVNDTI